MFHILAELAPLKVADGSRPVLRASSAQDRRLNGVAGQKWWPAIARRPSLAIPLFDGDFTQDVSPGSASFTLRLDTLANGDIDARTYRWAGAEVSLYAIDSDGSVDAAGSFAAASLDAVRIFKGRVERFSREGNGLALTASVDVEPFGKDVLALTYAGTGGAEGGADLKSRLKPWIFGRALNVEPVLVNSVDNVVQFSGYPIQGISALYERGASLGASIGNYPTYAALVAATIPAGRWATCHALAMARLGAPPYGVITGDVDGDNGGGFVRTTGAIIQRIATVRGIAADLIDTASFAALDSAVPYAINIVLTEQISVLDLARRLVRPCNAQAGVDFIGRLFAVRPQIGAAAITLDAQGRRMPPVRKCTEADVSPPYKRIMFGANRSWRVHTFEEIAFDSPLLDRGDYEASETYRRGNITTLSNGSRWLFVNDTPKIGSLPALDNADWQLMTAAITAGNITYEDGTAIEALKPAQAGADKTSENTAANTTMVGGKLSGVVLDELNLTGELGLDNENFVKRMEGVDPVTGFQRATIMVDYMGIARASQAIVAGPDGSVIGWAANEFYWYDTGVPGSVPRQAGKIVDGRWTLWDVYIDKLEVGSVIRQSINPGAVTASTTFTGPDVTITSASETAIIETGFFEVGDLLYGKAIAGVHFLQDGTLNFDTAMRIRSYIDTGAGYTLLDDFVSGQDVDSGNVRFCWNVGFSIELSSSTPTRIKITGQASLLPSGHGTLSSSAARTPVISLMKGQR